ncbi:MAG TPA: peptide-methionine (R)-S-oxide reductase, partial [Ferruginibacter sp.]|nr:peptide-methionine (R)-S-oxide reductase [Ferruginibacter sp.]
MKPVFYTVFILASVILYGCKNASQESQKTKPVVMDSNKNINPVYSNTDTSTVDMSNEEWKKSLPADVYHIAREKGTERAFTGKFWDFKDAGTYYCAACGNPLFNSNGKFESNCGWPS